MLDVNGHRLKYGDLVLEVGAPVNEPGTVIMIADGLGVDVRWKTDAEGDPLPSPGFVWYKSSTDLMKVFGQDEDGSYITNPK